MEKEGMNYPTIFPVEPGFLWHFVHLSLETCSLYHEKLFIQKFKKKQDRMQQNEIDGTNITFSKIHQLHCLKS